jgi:hypothetical protein
VPNVTAPNAIRQVWVLWDDETNRPRGKTHALDCHMFESFHWVKGGYRKVTVDEIPDDVGRCGFCGGGRPEPKTAKREQMAPLSRTPGKAPVTRRAEMVGALRLGHTARVREEGSGEVHTWTIVSPSEADVASGKLSTESPIAKALVGHVAGDAVTVEAPGGPRRYILELVS